MDGRTKTFAIVALLSGARSVVKWALIGLGMVVGLIAALLGQGGS